MTLSAALPAPARPFKQVDVFTDTLYLGNPLAVVLDATGLTTAAMQQFARWTQLSETTFVLPPSPQGMAAGADYQLRIFTLDAELPFAGHPTLGSCHAWLQAGGQPRAAQTVRQECGVGLVTIRRDGARLAFAAPPLRRSEPGRELLRQVCAALGLQPGQVRAAQLLDNGCCWLGLLLDQAETLHQLQPDHASLKNIGIHVGVAYLNPVATPAALIARSNREARAFGHPGRRAAEPEVELEVRAFAPALGIAEDPVTGSLHASLAQWLIADGLAPPHYTACQGMALGRFGQVHLSQDETGQVYVGGDCVTCIDGLVKL